MALAAIPAFAVKVTTDGKHNLEKAAGKYQGIEILKKNEKWYITKIHDGFDATETVPIVMEKNGKFSANYKKHENDTDQILFIELPEKTKATVDTNFNMNKVKGILV